MITYSEKKRDRERLQRKIDAMPKKKGKYHPIPGVPGNMLIFVEEGKDPAKVIELYKQRITSVYNTT